MTGQNKSSPLVPKHRPRLSIAVLLLLGCPPRLGPTSPNRTPGGREGSSCTYDAMCASSEYCDTRAEVCRRGAPCDTDDECNRETELCSSRAVCIPWNIPPGPDEIRVVARYRTSAQADPQIFRGNVLWRAGYESPGSSTERQYSPAEGSGRQRYVASTGAFIIPWHQVCGGDECDIIMDIDLATLDCRIEHTACLVRRQNRLCEVHVPCGDLARPRRP